MGKNNAMGNQIAICSSIVGDAMANQILHCIQKNDAMGNQIAISSSIVGDAMANQITISSSIVGEVVV